jgi:hypothetical protein
MKSMNSLLRKKNPTEQGSVSSLDVAQHVADPMSHVLNESGDLKVPETTAMRTVSRTVTILGDGKRVPRLSNN